MDEKLTIGKVAAAADVNVETIRFYQRRGILVEPPKKLRGLRYYDEAAIERVRFIKRAQTLGFTLDEVSALLALQKTNACAKTHDAAERKLKIVEDRIRDLERIRITLKGLIGQCKEGATDVSCPIIESLLHSKHP
ncbi:Hg(II)-responsive transcriptional regulator [Glaciimonas immobilis]|uniref:Mercuric resistance operon regulatory protein n=1 Tax=Glaciimonas immobilis TaxID=728004 RepID=A0A840RMF8_9BURK|nr:Hg(II)-responsive transcriptional regulator [Glaciimonas immobilis]KAF3999439.1 Hg(II)-responsive transcriptional regulator [Glaciimonas immobilis]MBB5198943.1 MerR family mercuric resistance operon transcriptional regulator [Glaciimonas immobilis]